MMNDMGGGGGGGGAGGFDDRGERPLTVTSVLKEFQGLKDKFKNEDEDDCECLPYIVRYENTRISVSCGVGLL